MLTASRVCKLNHRTAKQCRELVEKTAIKYGIPAVYLTAHIHLEVAYCARLEVWRVMIGEMKLSRQLVATIFGRDRRRLRQSVIGV